VKYFSIFFLSLLFCRPLAAQKQATWQQQNDYKINVTLFPKEQLLRGFISINYTNNSPDTLREIWIHIWPNAYKNTQTAYAQQQLANNKVDFQFSDPKDKGWIDSFAFTANGTPLNWLYDAQNIDILQVQLNTPLLPNQNITISTPFVEKLPKLFSRGGVNNSFFALTQWYPKPAVYDVNGWNKMPYLEQGEFYSDYGSFDVSITLPEKYLVAATGNLLTQTELDAYNNIIQTQEGLSNNHSNKLKTLQYHEDHVHDFAWFADTTFRINKDSVKLNNGNLVTTWAFASKKTSTWPAKNNVSATPVSKAVKAYSDKIGNYPYKNCTLVVGDIYAGGGMEYPTITVCESSDEDITMHEVGHNWFYGMLGTNERKYPWMDESINTFFEQKFGGQLKGNPDFFKSFSGKEWTNNYETMLAYLFSARQGISQPLNLSSEAFSNLNYGAIVYAKGPLLFAYLEQQLGDSLFELCFKNYFKAWQYKHPLPADMHSSFEQTSGQNLNWFFTDLLNENNSIDFVNRKHHKAIKGSAALDSTLKSRQYLKANPYGFLPETNYLNNGQKKKFIAINIPFHLPTQNTVVPINLSPILGYNYYDQLYLGAAIFNRSIFRKKLEYILMPAYAFGSKKMVGYGKINAVILPHTPSIYRIETGVQGQSFGQKSLQSYDNQYYRVNPYLKVFFRHKNNADNRYSKQLLINLYHTGLIDPYFRNKDTIVGNYSNTHFSNYIKASYLFLDRNPINRIKVIVNSEYGYNYKFNPMSAQYLKAWVNAEYKYQYAKGKFFKSYFFAGVFLNSKGDIRSRKFFLSGNSGNNDYLYNEAMLGRNETIFRDGLLGHQLISENGNMRNVLPLITGTDNWMIASANDINLPGLIPLKFYVDMGIYPYAYGNQTVSKPSLFTTLGLSLSCFKETLEIFVPLYQSTQFSKTYLWNQFNRSFVNSIGFKLNINQWEPTKMIDDFRM
jgi:hypothetical protein